MRKKAILLSVFIPIGVSVLLICILIISFFISFTPRHYETTSILDYGVFTGNYNNEYPEEFVMSFFPKEISPTFTDVKYTYRAQKGDTYAFEVLLEFHIDDTDAFLTYIDSVCNDSCWHTFDYDNQYVEYVIDEQFDPVGRLSEYDPANYEYIPIGYANIGRILVSKENQSIIYYAMGVYDGGLAKTTYFNLMFNRFQIDPLEYAHQVESRESHNDI